MKGSTVKQANCLLQKKALSERSNHPEKMLYRNAGSKSWINCWVSGPVYWVRLDEVSFLFSNLQSAVF